MTRNAVLGAGMRVAAGAAIAASLLLLSGCQAGEAAVEPSFHPLSDLAMVDQAQDHNGKAYSVRSEFIVIANPPADRKKLQALVDTYNEKTLPAEQLSRHYGYVRWFYKESAKMPRNYKESHKSYFDIDRLEHHGEDVVLIVTWEEFGKKRSYEFH